ncbi:MAG: ATP-dependent helicase, partial [Rhizobacter sp.]|nr:ATP-dependent helicase [Rhizobacter sp.]
MATFIPEWVKVSGRHLQVKRALSELDDEHVVRRPLRQDKTAADLFVEHHAKGWLAVAVDDATFAEIDPAQLFDSERRTAFERRLAALQELRTASEHSGRAIESLLIMWNCSTDEVRALIKLHTHRLGTRFVSREHFVQLGAKLVSGLLTPIPAECAQWLLGTYFPEAEIPAVCTTRRFFHRDNSAKLQRFFLDRQQEWASKWDLELPEEQAGAAKDLSVRLVNGVAGSGKTLIALSRAIMLAEMLPQQRLLVLIHNTPVVADIKERMHRARGGVPPNLEITTFFGWAYQQWRAVFNANPKMPQGPQMLVDLVKQARQQVPDLKHSDDQLIEEMDFINNALITDESQYLEVNRAGRGFALRPKERSQFWTVYEFVSGALRASRFRMWSALPRDICLAQRGQERLQQHHHILVDEAQFFAPSWFQLVKLSMVQEGQLFLCADPNQGFLKNRLSWKSVGLDVTGGRTRKLRKSYRTTKALLEAANRVLSALGRGDSDDYLEPDFAGMEVGGPPKLIYTESPQDSMDYVVNEVAAISAQNSVPLNALLVLYGENVQKFGLYKQLSSRVGADKVWWFNEKDQKKVPP